MKNESTFYIKYVICLVISISLQINGYTQINEEKIKVSRFNGATILPDNLTKAPKDIRMNTENGLSKADFFDEFFRTFGFSEGNKSQSFNVETDKSGMTHTRYKQYYKGIEIAEVQYTLHDKSGLVYHAHGNFVQGIDIDVIPAISEEQAMNTALNELKLNKTQPANLKQTSKVSKKEEGSSTIQLMIASVNRIYSAENFRLVYRCSVLSLQPFSNHFVYVDAQTGEVIRKVPLMYNDNIETEGVSPYNGVVDITVSDENYPTWNETTYWHTDDWNTYGDTGTCWWMADINLGLNGGYDNGWYQVLDTDPVTLTGTNPVLTFYHRYSVEAAEVYEDYDGWDGINVRISTDMGVTWQVLPSPTPAYTCSSLYSFGYQHNEGIDIPGWAGSETDWTQVTFNLSAYQGQTVMIRFAFASDPGYCTIDVPGFFGWQVDEITISSSSGTLMYNGGKETGMTIKNMAQDVNVIEGNYRLRETAHGSGVATYNALNGSSQASSVDFVEDDSYFDESENEAGIATHYALEKTYEYYSDRHERYSFDNDSARIIAFPNWLFEFSGGYHTPNNAMWSGGVMYFGAGDGLSYSSWTALDIVGHEFTHGVTEYTAGLIYESESGALNESFSDIFGCSVEIFTEGEGEGSWTMGEDHVLLMGEIVRSLEYPGLFANPDTYHGYYWVSTDNTPSESNDYNGVHSNCGVQNFWYYLLCKGGQGINDFHENYSVTGIGVLDAEQIAYRNLSLYLQPASTYYDAAFYSIQSAIDIFGEGSQQHNSVVDAWHAVGIYLEPKISVTSSLAFQAVVGEDTNLTIDIRNIGYGSLTIDSVRFSSEDYTITSLTHLPTDLSNLETFYVHFRMNSSVEGNFTDTAYVYSSDLLNPVKKVPLTADVNPPVDLYSQQNDQFLRISPNPFNVNTTIEFSLPQREYVTIKIYNLQGEVIKNIKTEYFEAGRNTVIWDGTSNQEIKVNPGIYLCILQSERFSQCCKIIAE